jgi:hypothetical protein
MAALFIKSIFPAQVARYAARHIIESIFPA